MEQLQLDYTEIERSNETMRQLLEESTRLIVIEEPQAVPDLPLPMRELDSSSSDEVVVDDSRVDDEVIIRDLTVQETPFRVSPPP